MNSGNREQLARQQRGLIDALAQDEPHADGFAPAQLRNTKLALQRKRMRGVERSWPNLAEGLGEAFQKAFGEYAQGHGLKPGESHEEDAFGFGAWLERKGRLPDSVQIEFAMRSMLRGGGWLRWVKPGGASRRVLLVRLPGWKIFTV